MKQDLNVKKRTNTPAAESATKKVEIKKQTESLEDILRDIEEEMARNPRAFLIF